MVMSSQSQNSTAPGGRRWLKLVAFAVAALLLLVVGGYFVLTSGWFVKTVILPKAGEAMQAQLSAEEVQVSPWSSVSLEGFKMQAKDASPLLVVKQLSVKYPSLGDLLKGRIILDEIFVDGLQVDLQEQADGKNNWSGLTKEAGKSTTPSASTAAPEVFIRKVRLTNTSITYSRREGTNSQVAEVKGLNLTLENLGNRQTATINGETTLTWRAQDGTNTQSVAVPLTLQGSVSLDSALLPTSSQGSLSLAIREAGGPLADTQGLAAKMNWDWTPTDIRQLSLAFTRSNQPLANLQVRGPFQPARGEGNLEFEIDRIGGQVLSLAAAFAGYSVPQATISARGRVELANQGQSLKVAGLVEALQLVVAQANQTTPPADLRLRFAFDADQSRQWMVIRELGLTATVSNRPLAQANLTQPMNLSWGSSQTPLEDSEFLLTVNDLNLGSWRALMPALDMDGRVDLRALVHSRNAGQILSLDFRGALRDLRMKVDTNLFTASEIQLDAKTLTTRFERTDVAHLGVSVLEPQGAVIKAVATGRVDHVRQDFDFKVSTDADLPKLLAKAGITNLHLNSGRSIWQGQITQKNLAPTNATTPLLTQTVISHWQLSDMTGHMDNYRWDRLSADLDSNIILSNQWVFIQELRARVSQSGQIAGILSVRGQHYLAQTNGRLSLQVSNLNERLFATLAPLFGSNHLDAARLDGNLQLAYAPNEWSATGALKLANLILRDPAGKWPREPLGMDVTLDAGQRAGILEARRLNTRFQFGQRDAGFLDLTGQWDSSRTNGQFKAEIRELNQHALRPWLAAQLAPVSLESIIINAIAEGRYQAGGSNFLNADLQINQLSWRDSAGATPNQPLSLGVKINAASPRPNQLELRTASLQLSPTSRATNLVRAQGQLDLTSATAITGRLDIVSESFDWTPYHPLFKSFSSTNTMASAPESATQQETPPTTLPLTNFVVTLNAQRFYWEELALSNLTASLRLDGPFVKLASLETVINGAPARARADINLGVPGSQYDVYLQLQRLPLAPLAATFLTPSPEPWQGDMSLAFALKGTGSTSPNLRRHLSGHFHLDVTNAALRIKQLITPPKGRTTTTSQQFLRVLVGILDPLLNAVGGAVGVPNLVAQPFQTSRLQLEIAQGNIELRDFTLANSTIIVGSRGRIPMADVLTASPLDLPVEISLSVPLAQRLQITSAPQGATHVKLPDFVVVRGTLENPQTRLNTKAITGTALQRVGKEVGGDAGALLQGLGNILGGGTKATTNAPAQPAVPQPTNKTNAPINNLINDLFRPKAK